MTDFQSYILSKFAKILVRVFGLILLPWSIFLAIRHKKLNLYYYEVSRGWDILANKLYAPALNSRLVKKGGKEFGDDETISQCMAYNKFFGFDTHTAKKWEKRINVFDKNHLEKTLNKNLN